MIKIHIVAVGDIKEKYLREAIAEYSKRISRYAKLNIVELKENNPASESEKDILQSLKKDANSIFPHLKGYVICLDLNAPQFTSTEFAKKIDNLSLKTGEITFVIGASNGIAEEIKAQANEKVSFSKMTFPHQLMRVIFLEQLYRAFTILNNVSYHK